ncbi:MAG TPA: CoF synthetase [Oceanospirillaceae bacterium]|nr:CoF synthetase [Oceanospirillaceae bacterium]
MGLLADGDFASPQKLNQHQQQTWAQQSHYVATHSIFYQQLWGDQQPPAQLTDLSQLPLSDKAMLRLSQAAHPPYGNYLAAAPQQANRFHRTSGTTGQAMNLVMSADDCYMTEVIGGRCQSAAGLGPQHTVVHCLNYQMWMGGLTDHLTLEKTGATVVPFGVGNTELLIRTILETGISAISCTPSYPAVLEQVVKEKFPQLSPQDLGLKLGLFGGEPGLDDPHFKTRIKNTWGMQARNANYGVTDAFCNFAAQCEHDTALHFMAADVLYPELIDPDTEQPIKIIAGAKGELVLTHLQRQCQPLVRFRTGDIIEITATQPCNCQRTGMRFKVVGRSDDMVVVRGLNLFPTMVATLINNHNQLSGDYRIVLDHAPPYSHLPIQVELADSAMSLSPAQTQQLAKDIAQQIKQQLGASAHVTLLDANCLPRTEGKTQRVIRNYL